MRPFRISFVVSVIELMFLFHMPLLREASGGVCSTRDVAQTLQLPQTRKVTVAFDSMPPEFKEQLDDLACKVFPANIRRFGDKLDMYDELQEHLAGGDDAAQAFVELAVDRIDSKKRKVLLRSPQKIFELWSERIEDWLAEGRIKEDEVTRLAIVFRLKVRKGQPLFVRPGIDPWPDPNLYEILPGMPPISSLTWAKLQAQGITPFSTGLQFVHEMAHASEIYGDPDLMAASRKFNESILARPKAWKDAYAATPMVFNPKPVDNNDPFQLFYLRAVVQTESMSLPHLGRGKEIRSLIPDYFSGAAPNNLDGARIPIDLLPMSKLKARALRIVEAAESVLIRQGGGQRDLYNVKSAYTTPGYYSPIDEAIRTGTTDVKYPHLANFPEMHRGNLYDLSREIDYLTKYPGLAKNPTARKLLADRIARFEFGLYTGWRLGITPAQVVLDNTKIGFNPSTTTGQFFQSFLSPETVTYQAYLSPEATKSGLAAKPKPK